MFKSIAISTFFAAAAFQVSAEPSSTYDLSILPADVAAHVTYLGQFGERFEPVIQATLAEWAKPSYTGGEAELDLSILPPGVADGVVKLQKYGDRFDAAIRAIFVEAMKPSSGFFNSEDEAVDAALAAPAS